MDMDKCALIRRYNSNIRLSGRFFIFFGLWSVIRVILMLTMNSGVKDAVFEDIEVDEADKWLFLVILIIVFAVIFMAVMGFHLFIGICAIRYGSGKSKNILFLILAAVDIVIVLISLPFNLDTTYYGIASVVASTVVDLTMVFLLSDMIWSAIKVKSLIKATKE